MLQIITIDEEVLCDLEQQGGLKDTTVNKRKRVYNHFTSFIQAETGQELEECLKSGIISARHLAGINGDFVYIGSKLIDCKLILIKCNQ